MKCYSVLCKSYHKNYLDFVRQLLLVPTFKTEKLHWKQKLPLLNSHHLRNRLLPNLVISHDYCTVTYRKGDSDRNEVENVLHRYGFNGDNIETIINYSPELIQLPKDNLLMNLNSWLQCQFGDQRFVALILRHPNLLFVQSKRIDRLYSFLISKYTKNYTYKIIFNSPQLLIDSEILVEEKFAYLENEMMVPKAEIANSSALGCSLHHIKERHELLKRVGVFKLPDKKTLDYANPRLDLIMSSTDDVFARKVAGISTLEYEVFQQLFSDEQED